MDARRISLEGGSARGAVISASVLHELLGVMLECSRKAVLLLVEGRSSASGDGPPWLDDAVAFDVVGFAEGSTQVLTQARPLREALAEHHGPIPWLDRTIGEASALDVFAWGLEDALLGKQDSDRFDAELLDAYRRFGRVLAKGFGSIELGGPEPVRIDVERMKLLDELEGRIPPPRRTRVTGTLERVEPGGRRFTLRLHDGSAVLGVADDELPAERLAAQLGARVTVTGRAVFKPSGGLLRMETTRVDEPRKGSEVWSMPPTPLFGFAEPVAKYRVPQTSTSGLNAVMGTWPGDEDDETVEATLELLS